MFLEKINSFKTKPFGKNTTHKSSRNRMHVNSQFKNKWLKKKPSIKNQKNKIKNKNKTKWFQVIFLISLYVNRYTNTTYCFSEESMLFEVIGKSALYKQSAWNKP